ncbi:MAG: type II toxin-antitoxin system VapC family toxin [Dehalococcoidia bacterium]
MRARRGSARLEIVARVVDASALIAVGYMEPRAAMVEDLLGDHELHAPALLSYEWANVAARKMSEHPGRVEELRGQARMLGERTVTLHDVDVLAVIDLAHETGLTAYDAAYLWLAEALGADLVTLDGLLARVAASRR